MKCRISGKQTQKLFSLGRIPMSDFINKEEKPRMGEEELELRFCEESKLVQLSESFEYEKMFGKYWYRSSTNPMMIKHLKDLYEEIESSVSLDTGEVFLDIACNDGTLLGFVNNNLIRVGIDPADDSFVKESRKKSDYIVQDYFSEKSYATLNLNKKAKIITTISMFYDLNDPVAFMKEVKNTLKDDGVWVVQMSYTPLMIEQLAFDNICHEHACYYTLTSFKKLSESCGFKILDCSLNDCNGGSFRIYLAKNNFDTTKFRNSQNRIIANMRIESFLAFEKKNGYDTKKPYIQFYNKIQNLKSQIIDFIRSKNKEGKLIIGYGASTKGNTLLSWFGITNKEIKFISEKSEHKFGLKTTAGNIEIISDEEMRRLNPDYLFVLPWHFIDNFLEREKDFINSGGKIIVPCPEFKVFSKEIK